MGLRWQPDPMTYLCWYLQLCGTTQEYSGGLAARPGNSEHVELTFAVVTKNPEWQPHYMIYLC